MSTEEPEPLSIETVIAGLDASEALEFTRRCTERVRSLERESQFESALRHIRLRHEASSWPGDDLPAGLLAARTAIALAYQVALGLEWEPDQPTSHVVDDVEDAIAAQDEMIAAVWSDLAAVQGADPSTAAVVGLLAPGWTEDCEASWHELLATAMRATGLDP